MKNLKLQGKSLSLSEIARGLRDWVDALSPKPRRVLLIPPDYTRYHSSAGMIAEILFELMDDHADVDIMPALGTHDPITDAQRVSMFGDIPADRFLVHDWRNDTVQVGEVPSEYVSKVSGGIVNFPISVELNRRIVAHDYDLIVSIGQVVPHEVVGMANYTKNIAVGCGGKDFIDKSHFMGAVYGMERMMGRTDTPVRRVLDYVEKHFLESVHLCYILTVTTSERGETKVHGLFAGYGRELFEDAAELARCHNLALLDKPLKKVVAYLDPDEFKSTWLGNKAIYRTRMAIDDGGELVIIAPGLRQFGEDPDFERLIRKYGYVGSRRLTEAVSQEQDLRNNLAVAAHLIHGSSEGRFRIIYAPGNLTKEDIESVNYEYMPLSEALETYRPDMLRDGFNRTFDGDWVFYVSNPALGLWALKENFC